MTAKMSPSSRHQPFWLEKLEKQGVSPCHPDGRSYPIWRDVKDFGAKGDGIHDDTAAINKAISSGNRCGDRKPGTDSSTISPALIYFPRGTYLVSAPIISHYNTSLVGDATDRPTLKAAPSFKGLAVIDENPYGAYGVNWYTPQNNFFRSVAHLIIDLTVVDPKTSTNGIHHQVSQSTGLRNVHFELRPFNDEIAKNEAGQTGIWMENASGGYLNGCSVRGGKIGFWLGNQQFTIQDCELQGCYKGISQHWNWTFVYHKIRITDCACAFEMRAATRDDAGAASVACLDWDVRNCAIGFDIVGEHRPAAGSLVLSNVKVSQTPSHVVRSYRKLDTPDCQGSRLLILSADLGQSSAVLNWTWQGDAPAITPDQTRTGNLHLPRPQEMLDEHAEWFYKPRPEYLNHSSSLFISVKDFGAKGDGVTDDTAALQAVFDRFSNGTHVIWIPHGHYLLTSTLVVSPGTRVVGEVWPVLMGTGDYFNDASNPKPVIQVGHFAGQQGLVEVSDCIFSTRGPTRGAIVLQWNLRCEGTKSIHNMPGLWDTHIRLGGFKGSNLEDGRFDCEKPLDVDNAWACFLAWYIPPEANGCFVNNWVWLADHTLDSEMENRRYAGQRISLLAARGILIEANPGPVFLWGGASEHFLLYQYQLFKARNVFIGHCQTESPYFLGNGVATADQLAPPQADWDDPQWKDTADTFDNRSWGLRIVSSQSIHLYGAGLYSFFDAYKENQLDARRCQRSLLCIEDKDDKERRHGGVNIVNLCTIGIKSMLDIGDGKKTSSCEEKLQEAEHRVGMPSIRGYYFA